MVKQSIFGRIAQLAKANINALIDAAEDPQKMLDQMVRDYTNNIVEAEAAVAQTIGNLRLLEQDHAEDLRDADEWGSKALAASNKADEFRAAGDTANADKFDNLAKIALFQVGHNLRPRCVIKLHPYLEIKAFFCWEKS